MPAPWNRRPAYQAPKPKPAEIAAAMLALAADDQAAARVAALSKRWGVQTPAKRRARTGRQSNAARGLAAEGTDSGKGVGSILRAEGYDVTRSHMSQGAADVVATMRDDCPHPDWPPTRKVQAKTLSEFKASGLNGAVRRLLGLGKWSANFHRPAASVRREAWLRIGRGEWTRVYIGYDDTLTATGPHAQEVLTSITRALAKDREPKHSTSNDAFLSRLKG